jgi:pSer/pThr/pTyr-binding forkhead associated (FHA) protein
MAILRLHRHGAPPLELDRERVLVGRDPGCDVVIDDKSVSRRHAALERRGAGFVVVDQGSANGSFVNGEQVSEAALYDGQELRLGMVPFRVEIESEVEGTILMSAGDAGPATMLMPSPMAAPPPAYAPPPPPVAPAPAYAAPAAPYAPAAPAYAPPPPAAPASPRDEAADLMGLAPHASPAEVKARLAEMSADLETRIANARTPNLKATYQKNLDDLKAAAEQLAPGMTTVDVQDLPSVQPTVVPDEMDISIPAPVRAALVHLDETAPERQSGVPATSTTVISFTVMSLIAVCAFFAMAKTKITKETKAFAASPEFKEANTLAVRYAPMDTLEKAGALKNGTLKLCNKSSHPLQAIWLGAVFGAPDKDGNLQIKSYNSQFCGEEFKLTVPANGQVPVRLQGSSEFCNWDGQGLFVSMIFQHPQDSNRAVHVARPFHNSDVCIEVGEGL